MAGPDPIDELLQQVLELPEATWRTGVADLCVRHPDHATEIQRRFAFLCSLGLHETDPEPAAQKAMPERLGEFRLLERLGQGGMGVVYAARQDQLDRTVALKLVRPEQLYFPGARARFQREIAAVSKLSHPGIVSVFSVGEEQGIPYLAMELLRGASLDDVVRTLAGRRVEELSGADLAAVVAARSGTAVERTSEELFTGPWTMVCAAIGRRLAQAVAHAHHSGVVHRDIKPNNVIVTSEGRVVLLDFGLAQPAGVDRMTRAGTHVGSVPYMAPEQLRGEAGDARTDVYGLGVLLRELLTLQQPFLSGSAETTRQRVLQGEGRPLAADNRAVPWELATVCAQATELDPRRRYASAADLARDLDNVLCKRPIAARPAGVTRRLVRWAQRWPALATGLLLGALAAIGTPTAIAVGIAGQRDRARAAEGLQEQRAFEANLAAANAALQLNDVTEARRRLDACPPERRSFEWQHLSLAVDGSLATFTGHEAAVTAVAMTADAACLASGSRDGRVRLWDATQGTTRHEWTHHRAAIRLLRFTADGKRLLVRDTAGNTSLVEVGSHAVLARRRRGTPQEAVVFGVDGQTVLASAGGWQIADLDPQTLKPRRELLLEQSGPAPGRLLVTDGRSLVSESSNTLQIWDLASGRLRQQLHDVTSEVQAMELSLAGDRLALADGFGRIAVLEFPGGKLVQAMTSPYAVRSLALDQSGSFVAAASADGAVRFWDVARGALLATRPGHSGPIHDVAFGQARMVVATAGEDQTVKLWSPFGSRDHQVLHGHVGVVAQLALTADGQRLVSASQDGSLRIWDVHTGLPAFSSEHAHHVNAVAVARDGTVFSAYQGCIDATLPGPPPHHRQLGCERGWVFDLACAGDLLLVADQTGCALLDPAGSRPARALRGLQGQATACALAADGAAAFGGSAEGHVVRWDLATSSEAATLAVETSEIVDLAVDAGAAALFIASADRLQRRDAMTGALAWLRTISSPARAIAVLPRSRRLVTGHVDGSVMFWDAASGEPLLTRKLGEAPVLAVVSDPAGRFLAAGAQDGSCHLLWAERPIATAQALQLAGTTAAMAVHGRLREGLRTGPEVLALIEGRVDLDPQLRAWMRACEQWWLPMPWSRVSAAAALVARPGLSPEIYAGARRVAEAYAAGKPRYPMAVATMAMASVRLREFDRALAATVTFTDDELGAANWDEPALRAARALARCGLGDRDGARADLAPLAAMAARPEAPPTAVSYWREVEAALRR